MYIFSERNVHLLTQFTIYSEQQTLLFIFCI